MTDFRVLCARMADELDHYRQLLVDDCREAHFLATEARLALAQPEPQGPTDEELLAAAAATIDPYQNSGIAIGEYEAETECALEVYGSELIAFARAVLARWGRPAIEPVPMSERLPARELNELDDQGTCWMFHPVNYHYCLCVPDPSVHTHWLPHHALPVPKSNSTTPGDQ